jgi:hypothetical protein
MTPPAFPIPRSVSIALGRLRLTVIACCWIIGLSLFAQLLIWSLAAYTELRFDQAAEVANGPVIVHAEVEAAAAINRVRERRASGQPEHSETDIPPNDGHAPASETTVDKQAAVAPPNVTEAAPSNSGRPMSRTDQQFATTFNFAAGFGHGAMLLLIPVIMLATLIAAGAGISSVDKSVSSFLWLLLVAVIVFPTGNLLSLPWESGALTSYEHMTSKVDQLHEQRRQRIAGVQPAADRPAVSTIEFHTRFGLLPISCIVGVALVGIRFCSSLEGAVVRDEPMRLDPVLEREAANIKPTSLHAGRSGSVLSRTMSGATDPEADRPMPSARGVSPGESPRRLI